jgi:hypothetical protein
MKVTSKYTGIKDPAILASAVDFYAPKLQRVPYPTVGGLRFVLDQVAIREPKAKNFAPETFMDTRFVKQLDESGYIKSLYPRRAKASIHVASEPIALVSRKTGSRRIASPGRWP